MSGSILVIEDDPSIMDNLQQILRIEGYQVHVAGNGQEALKVLVDIKAPPQLILLDLMMPVMNGFEFRSEQLKDPRFAPVPVVVMSARVGADKDSAEMKVSGLLTKPFEIERLLSVVAHFCAA
jgi:CheY-like chemotaxis protein